MRLHRLLGIIMLLNSRGIMKSGNLAKILETSERIVRPYGAVVKNLDWYLIAFCELKNEIRIFKCIRIKSIEVLDESFSMPLNFYLEEFWENSKHQFVRQAHLEVTHDSYPVKIKFYEEKKELLKAFMSYLP